VWSYPLRIPVTDIDTDAMRWVTVAYISQVETKCLETMKGQEVRSELLQRTRHVLFRTGLLENSGRDVAQSSRRRLRTGSSPSSSLRV